LLFGANKILWELNKWHPDKCKEKPERCKEVTQQINEAYQIIIVYCKNYKYSFREEDIERVLGKNHENWWYKRFGDDPIWGKGEDKR